MREKIEPVIYLDLDGVCTDFVGASIRTNGFSVEAIFERWQREYPAVYGPYTVMGIDRKVFWEEISLAGEEFWSQLEAYPWFRSLYDSLVQLAPVIFLSATPRSPSSLSGKLMWLHKHFDVTFRDFIFTAHKQQLAQSAALLVDDYDDNVKSFKKAGGKAVLFPQIWNSNYRIEDKLAYTLGQVESWLADLK